MDIVVFSLVSRVQTSVVGGKVKKPGKRGRKPAKIDLKAKLERSRQSARECRARKKLRYQYLEELVSSRERAICALREELEMILGGGCRNVKENR
uniref:cAMP-responsive element-binding protein-like 2 n=1 Tax=Molossus molossus TaxID=27622 RepID=A0A7J8FY29_MOLMO|nr:cAMP responsive element binding protein like 2 [Molossus molossus]